MVDHGPKAVMKPKCFCRLVILCLAALPASMNGSEPAVEGSPEAARPEKVVVAAPGLLPSGVLCFADGEEKSTTVTSYESEAHLAFCVTNISSEKITIVSAMGSCGCTTAKIPKTPWTLEPGDFGTIDVTMNTQGKKGTVGKGVTLLTDRGSKTLQVKVTIAESAGTNSAPDRDHNQMLAREDRQAIFKGDCVRCHVTPTLGRHGSQLFASACGICHESANRAAMVPDLNSKKPGTPDYWREWIGHGRPGSLMPAFAATEGGPLSESQIEELVNYLTQSRPNDQVSKGIGSTNGNPAFVIRPSPADLGRN
jgi:mono/diheme cytochrome c family protein